MKKRSRSTGSVVAVGDAKWKITLTVASYPMADGRWQQVRRSETVRGTRRDAERRLRELQSRRDRGQLAVDGRRRLGEWLDEYIANWCGSLEPNTRDKYSSLIRVHVPQGLRAVRLDRLAPSHIQDLVAEMERAGVGTRTIHATRGVLRSALNQALTLGYVPRNVAAGKLVRLPKHQATRRRSLSVEEAQRVLQACAGAKGELLVRLLLHSGARPAELLALKWDAVEAEGVRIERAITWPKGGGWRIKEPKTSSGRRFIRLPGDLMTLLRERQKAAMSAGRATQGFVFETGSGTPYDLCGARRSLIDPVFRRAGLTDVSPYSFRHTTGSLMLKGNVPLSVVSTLLGHADPRFTAAQYIHTDDGQMARASDALTEILRTGSV